MGANTLPVKYQPTWIDRAALKWAPTWGLRRVRSRIAGELALRHYEAAGGGRRTQNWNRSGTDAVQATGPFLGSLRNTSRDLVRNNPHAESALSTIAEDSVGWGIVATPKKPNQRALDIWNAWAGSTDCDADGRHDLPGLQQLVMRTVVESGEVLVRRRLRRPEDGFVLPLQLQVLEPDFLDTSKDSVALLPGGFRIVQGVEYDAIGRRVAYWLYPEHPGSAFATATSTRVPAENVLHIFKSQRPGQVRGVPWFAPVLLRFKDFDEYEDATLMKQKIAACLAVIVRGDDPSNPPFGVADTSVQPQIDSLEPGSFNYLPAGSSVDMVTPPTVREYSDYSQTSLRAIASGMGIPYEAMTGDYTELPFSAARLSRLSYWKRVESWRWRMLIPQFCIPSWRWAMQVAGVFGAGIVGDAEWTAPPAPMVDPVNEGLAYMRNIRAGIQSLSEVLRERGYDPKTVLKEIQSDTQLLDSLGIILDSDPRYMTQAGQLQGAAAESNDETAADLLEQAARRLRRAA
jgi:lambda family phage portal protein